MKPSIIVTIGLVLHCFTSVVVRAMPPELDQQEQGLNRAIESKIEEISDGLLRNATLELWRNVGAAPKNVDAEQLFGIRLDVYTVICFFEVFEVQHTDKSVMSAKETLKEVLKSGAAKFDWIKRPGAPDDLSREYKLLTHKLNQFCGKKSHGDGL